MGHPARQAIGKQLASNWQAVVKAGGDCIRPGEFARKTLAVNLQLGNAAVNLQRFAMLALRGIGP